MILTKAYIVEMSKSTVGIDQDEVDKVVAGMTSKSIIVVRRGIINPRYIVGIFEDESRMEAWEKLCSYGDENSEKAEKRGLYPLKNIFEGTKVGKMLEVNEQKRLQ